MIAVVRNPINSIHLPVQVNVPGEVISYWNSLCGNDTSRYNAGEVQRPSTIQAPNITRQ